MNATDDEMALARAVARNDATAVNTLFSDYVNPITEHVRALAPDIRNEALEDVIQEVFVRILRTAGTFDGSTTLTAFVMDIADKVARDNFGLGGSPVAV